MDNPRKPHDVLASSTQKAHLWLKDVGRELRAADQHMSYSALRAVLHALRECVPVDELAKFSAQLPVFVTGILYDGWKPRRKPRRLTRREFLSEVEAQLRGQSLEPGNAARAVLLAVSRHVSPGEVRSLRAILPREVRGLWQGLEDAAAGRRRHGAPARAVDEVDYVEDEAPAAEPEGTRFSGRDDEKSRQRPWRPSDRFGPGESHGYR